MLLFRVFLFWLYAKTFVFDTRILVSNAWGFSPLECDSYFNHKCLNVLYPLCFMFRFYRLSFSILLLGHVTEFYWVYFSPPMTSFLDLSFYYFTLGSMFPFTNFCVFVSPLFSHQVHTKWFYIPAVSDFGIRENSIKIKSIFLLPYVSMNVLALSGRIYIRVQYQ